MTKKLKLSKKTIAELNSTSKIVGGGTTQKDCQLTNQMVCHTKMECQTQDKVCLSYFNCEQTFGLCQTQEIFCRTAM